MSCVCCLFADDDVVSGVEGLAGSEVLRALARGELPVVVLVVAVAEPGLDADEWRAALVRRPDAEPGEALRRHRERFF